MRLKSAESGRLIIRVVSCTLRPFVLYPGRFVEHMSPTRDVAHMRRGRSHHPCDEGRLQRMPMLPVLRDALPRCVSKDVLATGAYLGAQLIAKPLRWDHLAKRKSPST